MSTLVNVVDKDERITFLQGSGFNREFTVYSEITDATHTVYSDNGFASSVGSIYSRVFWDSVTASFTLQSNTNIRLDPMAGVVTLPAKIEFDDFLGDKIRLFSASYVIGVSPFDLDYTSDRYHKWHSDTNQDAMILDADTGDLTITGNLIVGSFSGITGIIDDQVATLIQDGTGISWVYGAGTLTPTVSIAPFSTTDLAEGVNLYFTNERAQDAVGNILYNTATINFTYFDAGGQIFADVIQAGIDHTSIANIGSNAHSVIDNHLASTANPHNVNSTQVGNATAQWNASKIQGVTVDDTAINNGYVLQFNSGSGNLEYVAAGTGESNTASNVGTGQGVFKQKSGIDLEFYKIKAGSLMNISLLGNDITLSVAESSIDHTDITNIGSNDHSQIDTHISNLAVHYSKSTITLEDVRSNNNAVFGNIDLNGHNLVDADDINALTSLRLQSASGSSVFLAEGSDTLAVFDFSWHFYNVDNGGWFEWNINAVNKMKLNGSGLNVVDGYIANGSAGISQTINIADNDGITTHNLTFTLGILTAYSTS